MNKKLLLPIFMLASAAHAGGAYLGAGLGLSQVSGYSEGDFRTALDDGSFTSASTDDQDTAFKIFGGVQLNKNVAIEAAYTRLGEFKGSATSDGSGFLYAPGPVSYQGEANALSLAIKGIVSLNDKTSLFAKLGFARWESEEMLDNPGIFLEAEDDGTDPTFGLGAAFNVTEQATIQIELDRFTEILEEDVDIIGASFLFKF